MHPIKTVIDMKKALIPLSFICLIQFGNLAYAEHLYLLCIATPGTDSSESPGFQRYLGDRLLDIDITKKIVKFYSHVDSGPDTWNFDKPIVWANGIHRIQEADGKPNPDIVATVSINDDFIKLGSFELQANTPSLEWTLNRHTGMLESPPNNKLTCAKRNSI